MKSQYRKINNYTCEDCNSQYKRRDDAQKGSLKIHKKCLCRKCAYSFTGLKKRGKRKMPEHVKAACVKARKEKYPSVTLNCKRCNLEFKVPYAQRARIYCGKICQVKSVDHGPSIKKTSLCLICEKEHSHYGEKITCGRKCHANLVSTF